MNAIRVLIIFAKNHHLIGEMRLMVYHFVDSTSTHSYQVGLLESWYPIDESVKLVSFRVGKG